MKLYIYEKEKDSFENQIENECHQNSNGFIIKSGFKSKGENHNNSSKFILKKD